MPLDPQRLARVRAHLLAAAALVTAGCASSPPEHTVNEPRHINTPPDTAPTAAPTASVAADAPPSPPSPQPVHINTTKPNP